MTTTRHSETTDAAVVPLKPRTDDSLASNAHHHEWLGYINDLEED